MKGDNHVGKWSRGIAWSVLTAFGVAEGKHAIDLDHVHSEQRAFVRFGEPDVAFAGTSSGGPVMTSMGAAMDAANFMAAYGRRRTWHPAYYASPPSSAPLIFAALNASSS